MILAGTESKQRGPLQSTWKTKMAFASDRVSWWNMLCHFAWLSQTLVPVLVTAISRPDNMQLHELSLTQILIC